MTGRPPAGAMKGPEVLQEVEWMLDGDVHPLLIAQELHRSCESIYGLARNYQNPRVRAAFTGLGKKEKTP